MLWSICLNSTESHKIWDNTLANLIENVTAEQSPSSFGREIEGQIKIYANLDALLDSIQQCKPLSGLVATDGSVWVTYRPKAEAYRMDTSKTTRRDWSKSALSLLRVQFDDANGQLVSGLCWFAPIKVSTDDKT